MLENIKSLKLQQSEVLDQLERQILFEEKYGIAPHKISKILLKPSGWSRDREEVFMGYNSIVTMKNGDIHSIKGNVKRELDGDG